MNTFINFKVLILAAFLVAGVGIATDAKAQVGISVSFQTFYDDLAPYGRWFSHPRYGSVWSPSVGPDFQPYATNGRWIVTEYGNTWASDYEWGWAPFHYGRWYFDDYDWWVWVPDYEWGPAWVSWRTGGGYYGWAPLSPGLSVRVSINLPFNYWTFVPQMYITSPRLFSYCLPRARVNHVYHQTTIINNYYRSNNREYAYGPRRNDIERVTRQPVSVYRSNEVSRDRYRSGNFSVRERNSGNYEQPGNARVDAGRSTRADNDRPTRGNYERSTDAYRGDVGRGSDRTSRSNQPAERPAESRARENYERSRTDNSPERSAPSPGYGRRESAPERVESSNRGRSGEPTFSQPRSSSRAERGGAQPAPSVREGRNSQPRGDAGGGASRQAPSRERSGGGASREGRGGR
jgi:hypothetical protein